MFVPAIAVHGGAGTILKELLTSELENQYHTALQQAVEDGFKLLKKGHSSLDAVCATVAALEDCELFNAGKGSVFTATGSHEMDASVMWGKDKSAGAVSGVKGIKNPILLARQVMEKTEHIYLSGQGAIEFALENGFEILPDSYFYTSSRYEQWLELKGTGKTQLDHADHKKSLGTVGAVALDQKGNLAAATSTGGMTNKKFGRVGDSPLIGAGTYASNSTCAISCTGHGEYFIREVVAYDVSCLMEYGRLSLKDACELVVHQKLKNIGAEGGLIAVDRQGNLELPFNSPGMYRAWQKEGFPVKSAIF